MLVGRIIPVMNKLVFRPVESVKAGFCGYPHKSFLVFMYGVNKIITNAVAVCRLVMIVGEPVVLYIKYIYTTSPCSQPNLTGFVLDQYVHCICGETVIVLWIGNMMNDRTI